MKMKYNLLKDIAIITMGQSPDSSSYNEEGNGIPFYQGNADFGELYPIARVWCNSPKKTAKENDILISVRAPIGALNYAKEECCIGRGLAAITIENSSMRNYVFHFLKAQNKELNNKGTGSTFKAISKLVLEEVQVPVMSVEQQKVSMKLMDTIEQTIRQRKQELQKLDDLIKARFMELFGNPITREKDEELKALGDYCDLKAGKFVKASDIVENNVEGLYPCLGGNGQRGFVSDYTHDGDFHIIGRQGALCGNVQYASGKFHATEHAVVVTPRIEMDRYWLYYLLLQLNLNRYATGAAQPGLAVSNLEKIHVSVPKLSLQKKFADFARQSDKSKLAVQQSLEKTQELFDSLMQKYFG